MIYKRLKTTLSGLAAHQCGCCLVSANMDIRSLTVIAVGLLHCGFQLLFTSLISTNARTIERAPASSNQFNLTSQEYGEPVHGIYGAEPNMYEEGELFEGDIAGINPIGIMDKNVIVDASKKWLTKTIPYIIDIAKFGASDLQVISDAFQEYTQFTCIRFEPLATFKKSDFLVITALEGCWSYVGRRGGAQMISLEKPGCVHRGIVVHELMHALGVWHEQSRHDRDDYVTINWDNIGEKHKSNFQKRTVNESQTFDLEYDYGSVMHYSAYSFALNRTVPTIVAKRTGVSLGQRNGLSSTDRAKINKLYKCPTTIPPNS